MSLSEKQLAANRTDAAKSTGPKTPSARRNSANFELLANASLIEDESLPQFIALLNSFFAEFLPASPTERALVEKLGVYQWLLLRSLTLESAAIAHPRHPCHAFHRRSFPPLGVQTQRHPL
jgi:tRNA U34 5-methylaminomethyl-2-thiouridine-forming methyltransferase MnmC